MESELVMARRALQRLALKERASVVGWDRSQCSTSQTSVHGKKLERPS
jgi:hypothetical protein